MYGAGAGGGCGLHIPAISSTHLKEDENPQFFFYNFLQIYAERYLNLNLRKLFANSFIICDFFLNYLVDEIFDDVVFSSFFT